MIKYKLICKDCEISFDSWFVSSTEYERLEKKKFLKCHMCDSLNIEKTLMSPGVLISKNDFKVDNQIKKYKKIKKEILIHQKFIIKNFDYVGENFAYEARSAHYKNKKVSRGFYGTATRSDIKELKEEGIETEVMPWIKNNIN
tara:strand:+ start:576 stop:1004 length:429 start_codon:yes stop_codon:yes gene_type:complete